MPISGQVEVASEAIQQWPVGAALALVVLAASVTAVLAGVRWLRRSPADNFVSALAARDRLTVLMHPNPDPDAMASAMAVALLAEHAGTETDLCYVGEIRHQENRAFETVLGLELRHIDDVTDLTDDPVVLVDHNEPRGFAGAGGISPYAVVDHHPGKGTGKRFTDVREEYGACATILTEYLSARGFTTTPEGRNPVDWRVATALLYAILSDTAGFTRGPTAAEFNAASYLYPAADEEALERIANPPTEEGVLDVKARAIIERRKRGPFVVSDVGPVGNVDAIPQAAEELLSLEGVTAVVVYGDYDGTLHISGRSRDDRVHMGKTIRAVCDSIPMANGGGHARMGGGQLSMEHLNGIGPSGGISRGQLQDRLLGAMAGEV